MKYMVLIAGSDEAWEALDADTQRAQIARVRTWWDGHTATGEILEGYQLQPADTATTVRLDQAGNPTVTDGPFVEGKEMVGGYGIIEVPDLDAAIRLVSGWPGETTMEIRPVVER
ncbi:MAG: YciI family protein [Chloroflexota bacterium]